MPLVTLRDDGGGGAAAAAAALRAVFGGEDALDAYWSAYAGATSAAALVAEPHLEGPDCQLFAFVSARGGGVGKGEGLGKGEGRRARREGG